jgi:hypothetical protein
VCRKALLDGLLQVIVVDLHVFQLRHFVIFHRLLVSGLRLLYDACEDHELLLE